MALKFANNAESVLASSINSTQTSIVVQSGQGNRFPTLGAGDYFTATLVDTAGNLEIVRVSARVADTLTVLRGQEGTLARAFDAGAYIANQTTAAQLASFYNSDNDGADSGLDADLLDGRQSSTTAVANTVPVRDANGDLPGNITGNAATATTATTATNVSGGTASVTTLTATGASELQSVSATTLTTSGNATLGDAPADTHTINGSASVTQALSVGTTATITGAAALNGGTTTTTLSSTGNTSLAGGDWTLDTNGNVQRVIPGGSTLYPDFACRAWVNFNGGNGAIRGSGNVTSVTRTAAGTYTVNFTSAMPDTNYSNPTCVSNGASNSQILVQNNGATPSASSLALLSYNASNGVLGDNTYNHVSVFR